MQEHETDLFMSIFYKDFIKISSVLKEKAKTFVGENKKQKPREDIGDFDKIETIIEFLTEKFLHLQQ